MAEQELTPVENQAEADWKSPRAGKVVPASTYRLQFNQRFRLRDALEIVPYLAELGVSHCYSSPCFKAGRGSLHGYDVADFSCLNPEIGTLQEYRDFARELARHGMGQILDFVPNHMSIDASANPWWMDLLRNGQNSPYAKYFDIEWEPIEPALRNKILIPILGDQYGRALENQELRLTFEDGDFYLYYYEHKFPIAPPTYPQILSYRLEALESWLAESPALHELKSIIAALNDLPSCFESEPEKIAEGVRKRETIRKRLARLYRSSSEFREFLEENLELFNGRKGEPRSFDLLDALLSEQPYRLAYWRVASDEINYRRFFEINEYVAIRMENPEVFRAAHEFLMSLIEEGLIDGLRIDHPDGLFDPPGYFRELQKSCFVRKMLKALAAPAGATVASLEDQLKGLWEETAARALRSKRDLPIYLVVEKIALPGESLPEDWLVDGTVGYEFANALNGIFIDSRNARRFDEIYSRFIGKRLNFADVVYESKKLIMSTTMASEIRFLGQKLNRLWKRHRHLRDFSLFSLRDAIRETIACFPVYRTYIGGEGVVSERDRRYIEMAISAAKRRTPAADLSVYDCLRSALLLEYPEYFGPEDRLEQLDFVRRFQQYTGPVMAKGYEDTALYIYNRLVSLNEVGGDPKVFGITPSALHEQNLERLERWRYAMLTTSTHDTKRSEDVRARINVLSEMPAEWQKNLRLWRRLNRHKKVKVEGRPAPDANEEYLFYQTLIGAWPFDFERDYAGFVKRIQDYMTKATKEAKVNTSWINPNRQYDEAVAAFVAAVLDTSRPNEFLQSFLPFQKKVAHYGIYNSLAQVLIKIASPGVPDIYQGNEIWNFSLVDPDNRRDVDYRFIREALEELKRKIAGYGRTAPEFIDDLIRTKESGAIKLYTTWRALCFRKARRELFLEGDYIPLREEGSRAGHLFAFARRLKDHIAIAAAPRLLVSLVPETAEPLGEVWRDTYLVLPPGLKETLYANIFTGETVRARERGGKTVLALEEIFAVFPVALLDGRQS